MSRKRKPAVKVDTPLPPGLSHVAVSELQGEVRRQQDPHIHKEPDRPDFPTDNSKRCLVMAALYMRAYEFKKSIGC